MKTFIRAFVAASIISLGLIANPVCADIQVQTDKGLTAEQKAEVQVYANKLANQVESTESTISKVKEWTDFGASIGSGLASAAKELGVAANDFADTPVGKFTVFMIAWHFMSSQVIHIGLAILWITIMFPILLYIYRTSMFDITVETYEKGKGPNGKTKICTRTRRKKGTYDEAPPATMFAIASAITVVIFVILLLSM